ncbi:hypothetical protein ACIQPQ_02925 [Streptomyces sp. NPDC091281]|uniref:hypothetical protein n=1 Tax=Streptomyces sp. NPDC091281 TaxID=3365985 RepID=UPI00380F7D95
MPQHVVVGVVEDVLDLQAHPVVEIPKWRASCSFTCKSRLPVTMRTVPAGAPGGGSTASNRARPGRRCSMPEMFDAVDALVASRSALPSAEEQAPRPASMPVTYRAPARVSAEEAVRHTR